MAEKLPITTFDMLTLPVNLQMFKAMIPFFDYPLSKMLSMIIRINELNYTIQYYRYPRRAPMFAASSDGSFTTPANSISALLENEQFVNAILPYCPPEYANIIKNFKNFSKMSELFNIANAMNSGENRDPGSETNQGMDFGINPAILSGLFSGMTGAKDMTNDTPAENSGDNTSEPPPADQNSSMNNALNNLMNPEQQKMYDEYIKQLDFLDSKLNETDKENEE